jgi:hypothetical protein
MTSGSSSPPLQVRRLRFAAARNDIRARPMGFPSCVCRHTLREHYGGSRRVKDANACRLKECSCRWFRSCACGNPQSVQHLEACTGAPNVVRPSFST